MEFIMAVALLCQIPNGSSVYNSQSIQVGCQKELVKCVDATTLKHKVNYATALKWCVRDGRGMK